MPIIGRTGRRRIDMLLAPGPGGVSASALAGADVRAIQPPFFILPLEEVSGALGGAGVKSRDVVIEGIPFSYAIPMLTRWDIGYTAGDQRVRDIGI